MNRMDHNPRRHGERGQTIILVALTVVTMLAMAALAIDVVTLYVARTEMQRAADGAALAAAKAFVDSGVTTDPTNSTRQTLATDMATAMINSTIQQNKIGGVQPALVGTPTPDFTHDGNPQITVTLQRTDLPMFFARIWGNRAMTVTASAKAEAYNPSSSQTSTGNYVPIAPQCVKPLLVVNADGTRGGATFVSRITGAAAAGIIGEPLTLTQACTSGGPQTCTKSLDVLPSTFYPATVTNSPALCPSCSGSSSLEQDVECCDSRPYACGLVSANLQQTVDMNIRHSQLRRDSNNGVQCLINKPSNDTADMTDLLAGIGPARITSVSGPNSGNLVTASRSIATFPIIDADNAASNKIPVDGRVTVIGFLQLFVDDVAIVGNQTAITAHVLNVSGCGNSPTGTIAVMGGPFPNQTNSGGTSPIPVRLIH
jgi:hypothetical protein